MQAKWRCCQTDANQPQLFKNYNLLGRKKVAPLFESGGAGWLEDGSGSGAALLVEMVVN